MRKRQHSTHISCHREPVLSKEKGQRKSVGTKKGETRFWCHEHRSSNALRFRFHCLAAPKPARVEIAQLRNDHAIRFEGGDEDVVGFEVAVDYPVLVEIIHAPRDVEGDPDLVTHLERAFGDQRAKGTMRDEFHDDFHAFPLDRAAEESPENDSRVIVCSQWVVSKEVLTPHTGCVT